MGNGSWRVVIVGGVMWDERGLGAGNVFIEGGYAPKWNMIWGTSPAFGMLPYMLNELACVCALVVILLVAF